VLVAPASAADFGVSFTEMKQPKSNRVHVAE